MKTSELSVGEKEAQKTGSEALHPSILTKKTTIRYIEHVGQDN